MKNILTTILVLFTLGLNAQSDTTKCDCTYFTTKPMYHYYIVFDYTKGNGFGSGSWDYVLNEKIDDVKIINNIACCIKKKTIYDSIVITNWILLKTVQPKNIKK